MDFEIAVALIVWSLLILAVVLWLLDDDEVCW